MGSGQSSSKSAVSEKGGKSGDLQQNQSKLLAYILYI